jgi:hypothetical protein
MSELIRCERRRLGRYAAIGLSLVLAPAAAGALILLLFPPNMFTLAGAVFFFLIALLFSYPSLKMLQWVETDGRIIRGKRFFTRLTIERSVDDLAELRAALAQLQTGGRDPALGSIRAFNYQLMFRDRLFMFLSCLDMNDTGAFVEAVIADRATGLRMPIELAGAQLGSYGRSADAAMGRSYGYFAPGHLAVTVYLYRRGEPVADGVGDAAVRDEFNEAKQAVMEMRVGDEAPPSPKVSEGEARLGEDGAAPRALCGTFEFDLGNDIAESRLYVTGWRGHLLKVRATMPASYRSTWGPRLAQFESELGRLLR